MARMYAAPLVRTARAALNAVNVSTPFGSKPGIDARERHEAAQHQTRPDEQHERQRDLGDDDALTQSFARAQAGRATTRAQRLGEIRTRGSKRGNDSENHRRCQRRARA